MTDSTRAHRGVASALRVEAIRTRLGRRARAMSGASRCRLPKAFAASHGAWRAVDRRAAARARLGARRGARRHESSAARRQERCRSRFREPQRVPASRRLVAIGAAADRRHGSYGGALGGGPRARRAQGPGRPLREASATDAPMPGRVVAAHGRTSSTGAAPCPYGIDTAWRGSCPRER